jgi:hypothetical protein
VPDFAEHRIDDGVDAHIFKQKVVDVVKKSMSGVGFVILTVPLGRRFQQSGFLKTVELYAYGIGRFPEFTFKASQVSFCLAVNEELHQ